LVYRCILPDWKKEESPHLSKVREGEFSEEEIFELQENCYNVYYLPNYPESPAFPVTGDQITRFEFCFVDFDLKSGTYTSKEEFIGALSELAPAPTKIVDSGNGIHVYWRVSDLRAMEYLKLTRRLMRLLNTDPAVGQIYQLMRAPNTVNFKTKGDPKLCELLYEDDITYTCDQLDSILPIISLEDEEHCRQHYDKTYNNSPAESINDRIPQKFATLIRENKEAAEIWKGLRDDRSTGDYRLGHIMFASGFSRGEALSVLVNSAKALSRGPVHRSSYASNIVDKIWTYEEAAKEKGQKLSNSVRDILARGSDVTKGTRFACSRLIDDTEAGFRLGQVIGLVAGSGVGKTAMAMNMFRWFTTHNPDYHHFFVTLEQTDNEIAERWAKICQGDSRLHDKVHILSNYDDDGRFRNLSLDDIKRHILEFQAVHSRKVGTVVIDHIGVLARSNKNGESQGIIDVCKAMKGFAVETNTMVIMQSQSPREKAGIGDLELNKDAAYGTVFFESYCDYLLCIWQPLKRMYKQGAPTVMAFKYAKIRHKNQLKDKILEDVCYQLIFEPNTQTLRELTEDEEKSAQFFLKRATDARSLDRKTDIVEYDSRRLSGS
jgi:KaiC/GvpD/RAD55 family RecA-like ATPase